MSRGLRLVGKVAGDPNGLPCLALHGWLDNANSFDPLVALLPQYHWLALDLPGHGASQHRSADACYHFVDWTADVVAALDAMGWQRCVVVGHSMGAGIAALFAATCPQRALRLVLLDGLGPLTGEDADLPRRLSQHLMEMSRLPAKQPPLYRSREELALRLSKVVPRLSAASAAQLVARGTVACAGGFTWRCDPRLRGTAARLLSEAQVLAFLGQVGCPALLVRPDHGYPAPAAVLAARMAALRHLTLLRLPGGHHAHMETPEPVAAAMQAFLAAEAPLQRQIG